MNNAASSIVATRDDFSDLHVSADHAAIADLHRQTRALRSELAEVQPVISAAVLAATAFRLRDDDGLASALRILVGATRRFEEHRAL